MNEKNMSKEALERWAIIAKIMGLIDEIRAQKPSLVRTAWKLT